MMEIPEFIYLIEISRLVEILMLKIFLDCENICMKLSHFIDHLVVVCSENVCLIRDLYLLQNLHQYF